MKLINAEISYQENIGSSQPPRPARRRVYTSLLVTLSVLVGTVGVIYSMFPNRQSEVMTQVMLAYVDSPTGESASQELLNPTGTEVRAWSLGIFGQDVPWPELQDDLVPLSATRLRVFKRDLAIVRYKYLDEVVSVAFLRARDAPPRIHRRTEDNLHAVSWRHKQFTCITVGPAQSNEIWRKRLSAP